MVSSDALDSSASIQQIQRRYLGSLIPRRSIRRHDPFALPGDSGSLIVSEDANSAIGLLFALNNKGEYGIFVLIEDLLRPLRFAWGKLSDWNLNTKQQQNIRMRKNE
jgi:hypothetical protein